ncbi:5-hydroxytryptamine receptor [Nephila pilipes]|uniref:5-hydroxytryptamine receptor n=1 Tax=Nephila pilipes TaxID=299642 RepID=A0A8X6PRK4_NEPPI|nr:5-hydroxytryptamine receptor [Nephila pilipes]
MMNISDVYENLTFDTVLLLNGTNGNNSLDPGSSVASTAALSTVLSFLILFTIVGNISVIIAITREKALQTKGNCLVLSLAVADLLVACLVMPLGAVYEVNREWTLGKELCDIWTSFDVLCCTASILHLVAIAVDRYWAVTDIDYVRQRQSWHVGLTIMIVWLVALSISVAPLIGWKDALHEERVLSEKRCLISQDPGYQLFAICATFYVPLIVILLLYWRIFRVAQKRIRRRPGTRAESRLVSATVMASLVTEMTLISTTTSSSHPSEASRSEDYLWDQSKEQVLKKRRRVNLRSKRERKAAKTLTVITGVFVICWLPFFTMALLMPLCNDCQPSNTVFSFALWLGYANSMLNPVIYTVFSPDFRMAFKQIYLTSCRF